MQLHYDKDTHEHITDKWVQSKVLNPLSYLLTKEVVI